MQRQPPSETGRTIAERTCPESIAIMPDNMSTPLSVAAAAALAPIQETNSGLGKVISWNS